MYRLLTVTTEVNNLRVTVYGKCFLEYPKKENEQQLQHQAEVIVSKLLGISRFKLKEGSNYTWGYEDYNKENHSRLEVIDLDDVYTPVFLHTSHLSTEANKKKLIQLRTKLEFHKKLDKKLDKILNAEIEIDKYSSEIYSEIQRLEDELSDLKCEMDLPDDKFDEDESA